MTSSTAAQTLSNRQVIWVLAGSIGLALAIGSLVRLITAPPDQADISTSERVTTAGPSPLFEAPLTATTSTLVSANPALLRPSDPNVRVAQVAAGRSDPFAPLTRPSLTRPEASPATPAATAATTAPRAVVTSAPALPTVSIAANGPALPPLPTAEATPEASTAAPAAPRAAQNPVNAIELSGVVQVGDRIHVIVKEPNAKTSRYVGVGDSLAGGQVRVHRIELSDEPLVILAYNGQHYTRTIGSVVVAGRP